jgi:cystathionine beta-lyase/cystathionine gamma-synthase
MGAPRVSPLGISAISGKIRRFLPPSSGGSSLISDITLFGSIIMLLEKILKDNTLKTVVCEKKTVFCGENEAEIPGRMSSVYSALGKGLIKVEGTSMEGT